MNNHCKCFFFSWTSSSSSVLPVLVWCTLSRPTSASGSGRSSRWSSNNQTVISHSLNQLSNDFNRQEGIKDIAAYRVARGEGVSEDFMIKGAFFRMSFFSENTVEYFTFVNGCLTVKSFWANYVSRLCLFLSLFLLRKETKQDQRLCLTFPFHVLHCQPTPSPYIVVYFSCSGFNVFFKHWK